MPHAASVLTAPLFVAGNVRDIVEALPKGKNSLRLAGDADLDLIARRLHGAFHFALSLDVMAERQSFPPGRRRAWFKRLERHAGALIAALGLTPEQCADPGIPLPAGFDVHSVWHLRQLLFQAPAPVGAFPEADRWLGPVPEVEQRVREARELRVAQGGEWGFAAAEDARAAAIADLLIELLPRTLGCLTLLARAGAASTPQGVAGARPDALARELFAQLADVHVLMFNRGPKTRNSTSARCGPSVHWARRVLWTAARRFEDSPESGAFQNDLRSRAPALHELADLENSTLADRLDEGWRALKRRRRAARRPAPELDGTPANPGA